MSDFTQLLNGNVSPEALNTVVDELNKVISSNHNVPEGGMSNCANLAVVDGKVQLAYVGDTPWHGYGNRAERIMSVAEAGEFAGLFGHQIEKLSLCVDGRSDLKIPDRYGLWRTDCDPPIYYATVGDGYEVYTPEDLGNLIDEVFDGAAEIETAGAIGNGSKFWFLARMKETPVFDAANGDAIKSYVMATSAHDTSGKIRLYPTSVRVICNNTYVLSMSDRKGGYEFKHTKNVRETIANALPSMAKVRQEHAEYAELSKALASTEIGGETEVNDYFQRCIDTLAEKQFAGERITWDKIESGHMDRAIDAIADLTEQEAVRKSFRRYLRSRDKYLVELQTRFASERNNGNASIAGSIWAAVNTVTELANHSSLIRFRGEGAITRKFESVYDGKIADVQNAAYAEAKALLN